MLASAPLAGLSSWCSYHIPSVAPFPAFRRVWFSRKSQSCSGCFQILCCGFLPLTFLSRACFVLVILSVAPS